MCFDIGRAQSLENCRWADLIEMRGPNIILLNMDMRGPNTLSFKLINTCFRTMWYQQIRKFCPQVSTQDDDTSSNIFG